MFFVFFLIFLFFRQEECSHVLGRNESGYFTGDDIGQLALAVFKRQYLSYATMVSCQTSGDVRVFRTLTSHIPTSVMTPRTLWRLDRTYSRVGILQACTTPVPIQAYVNSTYRWLFVTKNSFDSLAELQLRFDSSITVSVPEGNSFTILDIDPKKTARRVGRFKEGSLVNWIDAENAMFRSRISRPVKSGVLVSNLSQWTGDEPFNMERFKLPRGHPLVPTIFSSQKDFNIYLAITELYNITMIPHFYDRGGYVNQYGFYSHMMGGLQNHEIELAATKIILRAYRFNTVDYLNTCDLFNLGVVYYVGQSHDSTGAIFQPFRRSVWVSLLAVVVLGVFILANIALCEHNNASIGASILIMLGTFSGQGHPAGLQWLSGRAALLVLLFTSFVVASSYSAVIIRALLSAPNTNIRNRAEFMRTPLPLTVENFFTLTNEIFSTEMDRSTRDLYEQKVRPPLGGGFNTVSGAFNGLLKERWAIFGLVNNIKLEMAKATPQQVCRMAWIPNCVTYDGMICPLATKRSQLKNILNRGYPLIKERGLDDREEKRHYATDVQCLADFQRQWAPVKIEFVFSAVILVIAGVLVACLICILEIFIAHLKRKK